MKNKNTMSLRRFVWENIYWGIILMIWYQNLMFVCFPDLTYNESKILSWVMLFASALIGCILTFKKRRNYISVLVNVLLALEIYSIFGYYRYFKTEILILVAVTSVLIIIFAVLVFSTKIKNRKNRISIFKNRVSHVFLGTRTIFAFCIAILLVPFGIKTTLGYSIFQPLEPAVNYSCSEEYTIANNADEVVKLEEDVWMTLTFQEKLDLMQTIANIERNYLGISHELNVEAATLDDSTHGYYDDSRHLIVLNITHLENDSSYEVLDTLCHEAYHAYQHRQLDAFNQLDDDSRNLLMFYDVQKYKEEFEGGYIDGDEDFSAYYLQISEWEAREYAEEAVNDYTESTY